MVKAASASVCSRSVARKKEMIVTADLRREVLNEKAGELEAQFVDL